MERIRISELLVDETLTAKKNLTIHRLINEKLEEKRDYFKKGEEAKTKGKIEWVEIVVGKQIKLEPKKTPIVVVFERRKV